MSARPLPPGHTRAWDLERQTVGDARMRRRHPMDGPAPSAGQDTDERRCGRCGQIPYVHGLPDSTCFYEPTEAAGQDTGQMRDEVSATAVLLAGIVLEPLDGHDIAWAAYKVTRDEIAKLIDQRAQAREQVARVADVVTQMEKLAAELHVDGRTDAANAIITALEKASE